MRHKFTLLLVALGLLLVSGCGRSSADYLARGKRQMEEGKAGDARLSFRRAVQADPQSGVAFKALGEASLKSGDVSEALNSYSSASELLPDDVGVRESLAEILLGAYLASPKRPDYLKERLISVVGTIERLKPDSADIWRIRGMLAGAEGKYDDALAHFQRANAKPPHRPGLKLLELQAQLDSGDVAGAEAGAQVLIERNPEFGAAYDWLLRLYERDRKVKQAEALLVRKVESNSDNISYKLQLARFYSQTANPAAADQVIRQSLSSASGESPLIQVGDFYLSMGDPGKATAYFEQAMQAGQPSRSVARKRLAVVLGVQGRVGEALTLLTEVRKIDRDDVEAARIEAELRARSGEPKDLQIAVAIFRELLIRNPGDAGARYGLAVALLASGEVKGGREELLRCVSVNPNHRAAVAALADLYRKAGDFRGMQLLGESILGALPDSGLGRLLRAEGLIGLKRPAEARSLAASVDQDPALSTDATLLVAKAYAAERNFQAAELVLTRLRGTNSKDLRAVNALSDVLLSQGRRVQVVDLWRSELRKSPQSPALRRGFAKSLYLARDYTQAIQVYRGLLSSDPADVEATTLLAASLLGSGEKEAALAMFKQAAEMKGAEQTMIEGILAFLYQFESDGAAAELYYRRILSREPENHFAMNNLAYLLADKGGSLKEAAQLASRALGVQPDNADYLDTLAFVSIKAGNAKEAERTLVTLVNKLPSNPAYRFHLGLALAQMGRTAEARRELSRALADAQSPELVIRIKSAMDTH